MNEQKISWKRSDLKWRGKQAFKKNYWSAVLVSLVLAIVMATGGSGAATGSAEEIRIAIERKKKKNETEPILMV